MMSYHSLNAWDNPLLESTGLQLRCTQDSLSAISNDMQITLHDIRSYVKKDNALTYDCALAGKNDLPANFSFLKYNLKIKDVLEQH